MAPREGRNPALTDVRRRVSRRIAGAYFLFAAAWIVFSDLALFELTKDLPGFAGGSLAKGGLFVVVTTMLLYLLVSQSLPASPASLPSTLRAGAHPRRLHPAAVFGIVAVAAIAVILATSLQQSGERREEERNDLRAILELKAGQIELLLDLMRGTATSYGRARGLRDDLTRLAQRPDAAMVAAISSRVEDLQRDLGIDAALVIDADGQVVAGSASDRSLMQVSPTMSDRVSRSLGSGEVEFHFLHRDDQLPGEPVLLDYIMPLQGTSKDTWIVGALVLRQNARTRMFRLIQQWPTPSPTAETLLVRRDGEDVLFLNDTRHGKDTAFRLRRPLSEVRLPAVKALSAPTTMLADGRDYRGVEVVAAARRIAGTDWHLVAKVDKNEALAPVRESAVIWIVFILGMMLIATAGVAYLWRQQMQLTAAHEHAEAAEREALVRHFDYLSKYANDFIFLIDEAGRIVEVNDRIMEMYQWSREELIGRPVFDLRAPGHEVTDDERHSILGQDKGMIFETEHRRRDGSVFPVEISNRAIEVEGRRYVQGIARDITERKRAEETLRQSEGRYRGLVEQSLAGIYLIQGNRFRYVNPRFAEIFGYVSPGEIVDRLAIEDLVAPEHRQLVMENLRRRLAGEIPEMRYGFVGMRRDGAPVDVEVHGRSISYQGSPAVIGMILDVTERKQSEARIARLTQLRNALSDVNRAIVHAAGEDALFADICAIAVRHTGFVLAWIGVPDPASGAIFPLTSAGGPAGLEHLGRLKMSSHDVPEGRGPAGTAVREGHAVISNDFLGNARNAPWHEIARAANIRACCAFPLRRGGEVVAVLSVYSNTVGYFDAEIAALLEEMAQDVSFSLDVLASNRERERAQREVEYKNIVLSTQQETSPDAILVVDENARIVTYNRKFVELLSIPEELVRAGEDEPVLRHAVSQMQDPDAFLAKVRYLYEHREEKSYDEVHTRDGRIVDRYSSPVIGPDGKYYGRVWYFRDITARKRTEDAIAQLAAIVEHSNDAIVSRGLDRTIRSWNPAAERLFGWKAEEAIGRSVSLLIPPEREEESVRNRELLARGAGVPTYDTVRLTKDGRRVDVSLTHSAIRNANGEVTGISLVFRDISERIRAEQAQIRLAAIVESSSDAIISRGMDGNILTWNAAAERMFGWSEQEAMGQPITIIVPPERRGEVRPIIERVVAGKAVGAVESTHRRKDGSRIDTSTTFSAIRDARGDVTAVSIIYRDVTEHKKADAALRESEARFRAVLEQSIAAVYVIQDNRVVYVNPRMREIFGYGPDEPFDPDPLAHVQESERAQVTEQLTRRLGIEPEAAYTIGAVRKDGTPFSLGVHAKLASFEGKPAIIAIAQDITEKARAEEEIKRYVARLEQAMQSTISVVTTIGELRDPYTRGHERRVGEISAAIATEMGLEESRVEGIRITGYLHDVGKIGVPAEILSKPSRLTKAEFELVKDHAQQSYEILRTVPFPWPVAETAWQHHERLDGSGYPRGLKGDAIILEARILAVADVVEAMSSHRPYRPGLGLEKALDEIGKNRGKLYDPQVADACLRLFREKDYSIPA
ncbi:MAG: hypothetical protein A3I02_08060 [Betaproteobacteria bacterium RIFCSPLOWO2_02_FULL_67_26]|nr:MAG: hypothetical protein A3I02_08060 [Betaproteobacteria bacterium RIFCSPLOWO2_02_FULL_67_26]